MTTLTETAYVTRKLINIGAIIFVLVIILRVLILFGIGVKEKIFPPAPAPATVAFGKLPYPNAQNSVASVSAGLTYTLETIDGALPKLPPTMKVYFMPKAGPGFGTFDKMKALAGRVGFTDVTQKTGETSWRFVDKENSLRVLDIDETSNNFRVTYDYLSDLSIFSERSFTSSESMIAQAQSYFEKLGVLTTDLKSGTPSAGLLRFESGTFAPATAISNADAVSVTLNRAEIDRMPIVSPDARFGLVSVLFSSSPDPKKHLLEARYFYSSIGVENWATYPLIKAAEAFEELKAGKAIIAGLPTIMPTTIVVRQVFLAYLDPYPPQSYLQPVLVFSDQKGFIAYVPVVSREWLE